MKILAVDFDGTLASTAWPEIGKQKLIHKAVMAYVKHKQRNGWRIALWTLRENKDHKDDDYLDFAVNWCRERGLEFDYVNANPESMTDKWGFSRKLAYELLIDDKNIGLLGFFLRLCDKY